MYICYYTFDIHKSLISCDRLSGYLGDVIFHMHFFPSFGIAITSIIEILAAIILVLFLLERPCGLGACLDHFMEDVLVFEFTLKGIHLDHYANIYNMRSYVLYAEL